MLVYFSYILIRIFNYFCVCSKSAELTTKSADISHEKSAKKKTNLLARHCTYLGFQPGHLLLQLGHHLALLGELDLHVHQFVLHARLQVRVSAIGTKRLFSLFARTGNASRPRTGEYQIGRFTIKPIYKKHKQSFHTFFINVV